MDAFAKGQIKLPEGEFKDSMPIQVKIAPSFITFSVGGRAARRRGSNSDQPLLYYTNHTLAEFLGWLTPNGSPQDRVTGAVAALAFIEQTYLEQSDFRGQACCVEAGARRCPEAITQIIGPDGWLPTCANS